LTSFYGFFLEADHMKTAAYKLNEYRIIEDETGRLRWETHHGFGVQRWGVCFIFEDILIIGSCSHEEVGYLKGDFLDRLRKLPFWNKTKFYCFASDLFDVSSGQSLDQGWTDRIPLTQGIERTRAQAPKDEAPETFRLGKYKINVALNSQVSWKALEGMNRVVGGQCTIKSGVLLIGPKEYETGGQRRREFINELNEMTPWQRTAFWSHSFALRPCESDTQTERLNVTGEKAMWRDHKYREHHTFSTLWIGKQKSLRPPGIKLKTPSRPQLRLPSSLEFRKPSWLLQRRKEIRFLLFIPLLLAALIFGLVLILDSVKETTHRHHSSEEHRHR
jgi:hypothetical protein